MTQRPEDDSPNPAQPPQAKKNETTPQSRQAVETLLRVKTVQRRRRQGKDRRHEDRPLAAESRPQRRRLRPIR